MRLKKRQRQYIEDALPCTSKRVKRSIDNVKSLGERAEQHLIVTARMPIGALTPQWSIGDNRQVEARHVQKLCAIFKNGGLKRNAKENRILLLSSRNEVAKMNKHLGLDEDATVSPSGDILAFDEWLWVHKDKKLEVMAGQHRIRALEAYVRQLSLSENELWWTCDIYDRDTLPNELNLQLRINRKDTVMADSHGQIWAQVVAASHQNDALLLEEKSDALRRQITDALQLSSEVHFPMSRFVTIWRNERWREMTTKWCETPVGRDTFKISTWNWMISCRIDDYWFSAFHSVLHTLSQLPGETAKRLSGADWRRMSSSLPAQRNTIQTQELFYPNLAAEEIGPNTKRRAKFLAELDDQAFWDVYMRITKTPRLRFTDIHQLLDLSQDDGRILFQVMSHVVTWLNPTPTVIINQRDNKKPALRSDIVPKLQKIPAKCIREAERRLDMFVCDITSAASGGETASVLLQQEVLDFTRTRLKAFKAPAMKAYLDQTSDNNGVKYAERFQQAEWMELLDIVRRYQGEGFKEGWTTARMNDGRVGSTAIALTESAMQQATELTSFLKSMPEFARNTAIESSAFHTAIAAWFSQKKGSGELDGEAQSDGPSDRELYSLDRDSETPGVMIDELSGRIFTASQEDRLVQQQQQQQQKMRRPLPTSSSLSRGGRFPIDKDDEISEARVMGLSDGDKGIGEGQGPPQAVSSGEDQLFGSRLTVGAPKLTVFNKMRKPVRGEKSEASWKKGLRAGR